MPPGPSLPAPVNPSAGGFENTHSARNNAYAFPHDDDDDDSAADGFGGVSVFGSQVNLRGGHGSATSNADGRGRNGDGFHMTAGGMSALPYSSSSSGASRGRGASSAEAFDDDDEYGEFEMGGSGAASVPPSRAAKPPAPPQHPQHHQQQFMPPPYPPQQQQQRQQPLQPPQAKRPRMDAFGLPPELVFGSAAGGSDSASGSAGSSGTASVGALSRLRAPINKPPGMAAAAASAASTSSSSSSSSMAGRASGAQQRQGSGGGGGRKAPPPSSITDLLVFDEEPCIEPDDDLCPPSFDQSSWVQAMNAKPEFVVQSAGLPAQSSASSGPQVGNKRPPVVGPFGNGRPATGPQVGRGNAVLTLRRLLQHLPPHMCHNLAFEGPLEALLADLRNPSTTARSVSIAISGMRPHPATVLAVTFFVGRVVGSSSSAGPSFPPFFVLPLCSEALLLEAVPMPQLSSAQGQGQGQGRLLARDERWKAFAEILCANATLLKFCYDLKSALYALLRCPVTRGYPYSTRCNIVDPVVAAWMLCPDWTAAQGPGLTKGHLEGGYINGRHGIKSAYESVAAKKADDVLSLDSICRTFECTYPSPVTGGPLTSLNSASQRSGGGAPFNADPFVHTLQLADVCLGLVRRINFHGLSVSFFQQEMRVIPSLASMELSGLRFDPVTLGLGYGQGHGGSLSRLIDDRLRKLEHEAYQYNDHHAPYLLSSPKEVAAILYDRLGLQAPDKVENHNKNSRIGEKRHKSVGEAALRYLMAHSGHPLPGIILEHRKLFRAKTGFIVPLLQHCTDGNMHTRLQQVRAGTGRLSSTSPNLQNVPKEGRGISVPEREGAGGGSDDEADDDDDDGEDDDDIEVLDSDGASGGSGARASAAAAGSNSSKGVSKQFGTLLRSSFVAAPGKVLLSLDFSQIEVRVLASFAADHELLKVFNDTAPPPSSSSASAATSANGNDIYYRMAAQIYRKPVHMVEKKEREAAKVVCLGMLYGQGDKEIATKLGISPMEAAKIKSTFNSSYPGAQRFIAAAKKFGSTYGWVPTLSGRKRWLLDIFSRNPYERSYGERQAVNTIIQGSAADIMKCGLYAIDAWLRTGEDVGAKWTATGPASGIPRARLLLQIHDELLFEVDNDDPEHLAAFIETARRHLSQNGPALAADMGLRTRQKVTAAAEAAARGGGGAGSVSAGGASVSSSSSFAAGGGAPLPLSIATPAHLSKASTEAYEQLFRSSFAMRVQLPVNVKVGPNWGELKPYP